MKGEHIVFSIIGNNHTLTNRKALEAIDSIVKVVIDDIPSKK